MLCLCHKRCLFLWTLMHWGHIVVAVNKQLNDKERVVAALENPNLRQLVDECICSTEMWIRAFYFYSLVQIRDCIVWLRDCSLSLFVLSLHILRCLNVVYCFDNVTNLFFMVTATWSYPERAAKKLSINQRTVLVLDFSIVLRIAWVYKIWNIPSQS